MKATARQARKFSAARALLDGAVAAHKGGRLDEAERKYEKFLSAQPNASPVIRLLGLLRYQRGEIDLAIELFRKALACDPDNAEAYRNLGIALRDKGEDAEAVLVLRKAVAVRPDYAEGHRNLGIALQATDALEEAVAAFSRAIALKPDYADAHMNLGAAFLAQGRTADALTAQRHAITLKPSLTAAHTNLGLALVEDGKIDEAIESYRHALSLRADHIEAHLNLGAALAAQRRFDEAFAAQRRAIEINPGHSNARRHFGVALQEAGRFEEAEKALRKAIALDPRNAEAYNNLGTLLDTQGRLDASLDAHRTALTLRPDNSDAHMGFGMTLLLHGRYEEGFREYEWRRRNKKPSPYAAVPEWDGSDLCGRTLLLHTEQGFGDTIQFMRYVPPVAALNGKVIVEVQAGLARLFQQTLPDVEIVPRGTPLPGYDLQFPLMSLAMLTGTAPHSVPNAIPYLRADLERAEHWRARLPANTFNIGIVWQGNPAGAIDRGRSIPLAAFAPLAAIEGISLISLQKNFGLEQLEALPGSMPVSTLPDDFDEGPDAFLDTVAVMMSLDLVVTSDTSIAHVAGALGRPTWVFLKHRPDWRWMLAREDSPWYPTARLFRQPAPGDWEGAVGAAAKELALVVRGDSARLAPPRH